MTSRRCARRQAGAAVILHRDDPLPLSSSHLLRLSSSNHLLPFGGRQCQRPRFSQRPVQRSLSSEAMAPAASWWRVRALPPLATPPRWRAQSSRLSTRCFSNSDASECSQGCAWYRGRTRGCGWVLTPQPSAPRRQRPPPTTEGSPLLQARCASSCPTTASMDRGSA